MVYSGAGKEEKIAATLLTPTATAASAVVSGAAIDISRYSEATFFIDHARNAAGAAVGAGTEYRIEASQQATGNDTWRTLTSVVCGITAPTAIITDGAEAVGQTRIECGASLPAVGDRVFFLNGTIANSEWSRVVAIDATGGSEYFDIQDALRFAQPQQTMYTRSEHFVLTVSLKSVNRIRYVVNNANGTTNQAIVSRISIIARG
jgi:hypothetical protein